MRKSTTITMLIQELSFLLDKNISYSIEEVHRHIEDKDVINWLEKEFPFGTDYGLDFSAFESRHRDWLHDELESYWGGYVGQEKRKWGIENNGLCILLSWSVEITRSLINNDEMLR